MLDEVVSLTGKIVSPHGEKLTMKRGRPSLDEVARIERAILNAARTLFLTEGFEGASMEQVAAATGITRATLYNRHPTKAALFHAVIRGMVADRFAQTDSFGSAPPTNIAAILKWRATDMAALLADPLFKAFHRLILSNRHRFPELGAMMHDIGYRRAVNLLADDLRSAALRDGVPVRQPERIAEHVLTAIHGWFLQHDLVRDVAAAEIEDYGHQVIEMLLPSRDRW